jgi:hypothetical protein
MSRIRRVRMTRRETALSEDHVLRGFVTVALGLEALAPGALVRAAPLALGYRQLVAEIRQRRGAQRSRLRRKGSR